jgi:quinol monooxygenase YgiN
VDVTTETSITGSGTGATFEAALAVAVESTRQSAGQIFYIVQRDGAV